jgi:long-chain acyl-CoA synthetase
VFRRKDNWKTNIYYYTGELPQVEADTIPKIFELNAKHYADRVFMTRKSLGIWQSYTWREVYDHVKYFCLGLINLGLKPEETVAIGGENEQQLFWAEYATLAARAKVACFYPDMTPPEIQYILENSDAVYFVGEDQEQVDKVLEVKDQLPRLRKIIYWDDRGMWQYDDPILMDFEEVQNKGKEYAEQHPDLFEKGIEEGKAEDMAVLSYTSGTTGLPKGVIITHKGLIDTAYRSLMHVPTKPFTRYLSYISPAWATEQMFGITIGLIAPMVINFPEEPETVVQNIRELGAEVLVFGPRQWEAFAAFVQARMLDAGPLRRLVYNTGMAVGLKVASARTEGKKISPIWKALYPLADLLVLRSLRDNLGLAKTYFAASGGAAMAPDVFRFFHAMGVNLRNGYGTTEMGLFTVHMGNKFNLETLGKWYTTHPEFGPPLEYKIDENGELLVRGASGFSGYYKKPDESEKAMAGGWYHTGDAVRMTEDGEMIYLDRVSDLRKLATGHPFPPQYIETRLRFSPYIKDVIILGDENKDFVSSMINIDAETIGRWAEKKGIAYSTFADLSQKAQVREIIQKEIEKVNRALDEQSRVKRFVNLPKELDPDEAELTRTRKLRRDFLEKRYQDIIGAIYGRKEELVAEVPVKYRDGRTAVVKNVTYINTVV